MKLGDLGVAKVGQPAQKCLDLSGLGRGVDLGVSGLLNNFLDQQHNVKLVDLGVAKVASNSVQAVLAFRCIS